MSSSKNKGSVIWFIGMSAAGKSAISKLVYNEIKKDISNVVLLDGDVLRQIFGNDADHTINGREKNARRLSNLSKFLSNEGIHVVAAVLSIFPEWQKWNRDNIPGYCQVFVDVPFEVLKKRETKGLYKAALNKEIKNVVGVDIDFPKPIKNDLVLDNSKDRNDLTPLVKQVFRIKKITEYLK